MKDEIFLSEQKRLEEVIDLIKQKIIIAKENFTKQEKFKIGFKEGQRGTQFNRQALMSMYATEISNLESVLDNPYFGRFTFKSKEEGKIETIYIGKKAVTLEGGKAVCYDWRSPICSVYYDYNIGPASYDFKGQTFKGDILNKRQIMIKNGTLQKVLEEDVLSDDNILIEYLKENLDARLKSIIATIQKEQNQIIRRPLNSHNIVEGVAGSGKTTVALHRTSYLLYNNERDTKGEDFLSIGPNKYFLDFVSSLLPDLDIKNVSQNTFAEIATSIGGNTRFLSKNATLEKVLQGLLDTSVIKEKSSLNFLHLLEDFLTNYIKNNLQEDITYEGFTLASKDKLQIIYGSVINSNLSYKEKIDIFIKNLIKEIKTREDDLIHDIWLLYRDEFLSLPKDSPRRKEILRVHEEKTKEIKNGCLNTLKEYFSFIKIKPIDLYTKFILSLDDSKYDNLKRETLENIEKRSLSYEDLAPLTLIGYMLNGKGNYKNYQHLIIDEGQDLSLAEYYVLKKIFSEAYFDIFGDINQAIYDYNCITDWSILNDLIFDSKASLLNLNKSYRITTEISDLANKVLSYLGYDETLCVRRSKEDPKIREINKNNEWENYLLEIKDFLDKGYETIAIITKDGKEAKSLANKFQKKGLNINLITEQNTTYKGGLCIVPSYLAKGLEFDAVILANTNENNYQDNPIDLKLLYVAITRAMHSIYVNYNQKLTKSLDEKVLTKKLG